MSRPNTYSQVKLELADKHRSVDWYRTQIRNLSVSRSTALNDTRKTSRVTSGIVPGKLYLFTYDPKFKDVLPVWDRYPLVFPFSDAKGGFRAINLHYLPYGFRFFLIDNLKPIKGAAKSPENIERVKISWQILINLSSKASLSEAVKHYLANHVRSSFYEIPSSDWRTAASLPLQKFYYKK